ncbi:PREDICTED: probable 39S ribosomal protein L23, mitochondrial [Nicrophorus vespilloides]|uniref:Large ribosomal subunit protein uL23m n=1 Tax=Nicrophorus vespilloides TaxID=110193 RepID=A0ABM1NDN3_NICVS|nr:PREDICTED: probable 39S ribosomal protein L23, mitochondrial [Nicrophorus vespilloides]
MSTRIYPLYQRGGPQLRVFLPNFWMKLVRPQQEQPPNVVQFSCSIEMTKFDVKNYLEKIYGVKTVDVRTRIALGKTKRDLVNGYVVKEDDIKYAYAILPKDEVFKFPNLFPKEVEESQKQEEKSLEEAKKIYNQYVDRNKDRPNVPGWFSI